MAGLDILRQMGMWAVSYFWSGASGFQPSSAIGYGRLVPGDLEISAGSMIPPVGTDLCCNTSAGLCCLAQVG